MRRWLATLLLALLAAAAATRAAEVSPRQRALLLLRVLVYDRALPRRAEGVVKVAVVSQPGGDTSERDAMLAALEELSRSTRTAGLPVRTVAVPFEAPGAFAGELARLRPSAIYACASLGAAAPAVGEAARKAGVLAVAGERRLVLDAGFPVALVDRGDRAAVVIDPDAAAAAGSELDAALLSVAELVRRKGPAEVRP